MDWTHLRKVLAASKGHVLLYGPPGCGKTTEAVTTLEGEARDTHVYTLAREDTSVAELVGALTLAPDRNGFSWHDGPAMLAWRAPKGGLVINEIDCASGAVASALHAILDDPKVARLSLPTGETVKPEDFRCIATTNAPPEVLDGALLDRFAVRILVSKPSPEALAALAGPDAEFIEKAYSDPKNLVTLREWYAYRTLATSKGVTPAIAAEAVWGERGRAVADAHRLYLNHKVAAATADA